MILGATLIIIGLLFLGINFGFINPEVWPSLWRFWPIILIIFGIVMLARRFMPKKVSAVLVIAILALTALAAVLVASGVKTHQSGSQDQAGALRVDEPLSSNIKKMNVDIALGAQELKMDSLKSGLVQGEISTRGGSPKYSLDTVGDEANLKISQRWSFRNWFNKGGDNKPVSQISVTNQIPLTIRLAMGASKIDADLSDLLINNLTLKTGAINGTVKIGDRTSSVSIDIGTGASDITVYIPSASGLKVANKSGVTKIKYDKIDVNTQNGGVSQSNNFDSAKNKIYVDVRAGASSISFVGY